MATTLPQEIEVWYLIPALRKQLARIFVEDHNLKQKEAAEILGVTEAAISQYKSAKRGGDTPFSKEELERIKKVGKNILDDRVNGLKYFLELSQSFYGSKTLCALHHEHDKNIDKDCSICMDDNLVHIKK